MAGVVVGGVCVHPACLAPCPAPCPLPVAHPSTSCGVEAVAGGSSQEPGNSRVLQTADLEKCIVQQVHGKGLNRAQQF